MVQRGHRALEASLLLLQGRGLLRHTLCLDPCPLHRLTRRLGGGLGPGGTSFQLLGLGTSLCDLTLQLDSLEPAPAPPADPAPGAETTSVTNAPANQERIELEARIQSIREEIQQIETRTFRELDAALGRIEAVLGEGGRE